MATIAAHAEHRDKFIRHAWKMLEEDDLLQASEKIWGAVTHALKVIAKARGWPYTGHDDAFAIGQYVAALAQNDEIDKAVKEASAAHINFYEDSWEESDVRAALERVETLVATLTRLHEGLPPDTPPPDAPRYRGRHRLPQTLERLADSLRRLGVPEEDLLPAAREMQRRQAAGAGRGIRVRVGGRTLRLRARDGRVVDESTAATR